MDTWGATFWLFSANGFEDQIIRQTQVTLPDTGTKLPGEEPSLSVLDISGEGNGNPLRYSCLGNPMDRGARRAIAHEVAKSQTQLST